MKLEKTLRDVVLMILEVPGCIICRMLAQTEACGSITPLGRPVVPLEYGSTKISSKGSNYPKKAIKFKW